MQLVYGNQDYLGLFAKGDKRSDVRKYPGVLYSADESYNEIIFEFFGAYANLYLDMILSFLGIEKVEIDTLKQKIAHLSDLFREFIRESGRTNIDDIVNDLKKYEGGRIDLAKLKKVRTYIEKRSVFNSEKGKGEEFFGKYGRDEARDPWRSELFDIYAGRFLDGIHEKYFSLPVFFVDSLDVELNFERLKDEALTEEERRSAYKYRKLIYNSKFFEKLKMHTENEELKEWFDRASRLLHRYAMKRLNRDNFIDDELVKENLLLYYICILELSGVKFLEEEEGELQTKHPIVSKISVGERKNSYTYIIKNAVEKVGLSEKRMEKDDEFQEIKELLLKLYPEDKDDRQYKIFMKDLGKAVRRYLESLLKKSKRDADSFLKGLVFYKNDYLGRIDRVDFYWIRKNEDIVKFLFIYDEDFRSTCGAKNISIERFVKQFMEQSKKDNKNFWNTFHLDEEPLIKSFSDLFVYKKGEPRVRSLISSLKWYEKVDKKEELGWLLPLFTLQLAAFIGVLTLLRKAGILIIPMFMICRGEKKEEKEGNSHSETKTHNGKKGQNNSLEMRSYNFWNMARNFLFIYGYPAQTLAGVDLNALRNNFINIKVGSEFKLRLKQRRNALISMMKGNKILDLWFSSDSSLFPEGFNAKVYFVVEHSGPYFPDTLKNPDLPKLYTSLYTVYEIEIDSEKRLVRIKPFVDERGRNFFPVLAGKTYFLRDFYEFLKNMKEERKKGQNVFVYFVTYKKDSPLIHILKEYYDFTFPVFYSYFNSPVPLSLLERQEKKEQDKNKREYFTTGMFLSHSTLKLALDLLVLKEFNSLRNYIGFTAILPKSLLKLSSNSDEIPRFNQIVNLHVSLFFYDKLPETEMKIFRLSLLAWLRYNTEVDDFPYSKPKFLQQKFADCIIRRKGNTYNVDSFSMLVEGLYLLQEGLNRIEPK